MKKLAIILAVGAAGLLNVKPANAQIRLGLNLHFGNVGAHVVVAPPVQDVNYTSYDNDDDFYYLPDVEAYYDVAQQCYYYNDGNQWIHAAYLPGRRDYDWRNARRFEVRARRPYMNHDQYRTRFGGFDQRGGSFDNRYANRGGFDHRDDNRGGFDNRGNDNRGGWNGDNRGQQPNRGNQPQNNQYQNGGQQGQGRGNGNYGQPAGQNNGGQQQNQNRGNAQPQNNGGQQGRDGGNRGEEHFAANKMGMMRPTRF
jgi:hypothetical protein